MRSGQVIVASLLLIAGAAFVLAETVDSVEYKRWSASKQGSWVTHKVTVEGADGKKSEFELTTKLVELTPEKLSLETVKTAGGKETKEPKRDFPAKVEKKGEQKGERTEGDEEIEVAGKKLKCHWSQFKTEVKGEAETVKDWYSDEIPGTMARHEIKKEGPKGFTHTSIATKWEKK
jgi:hypothetical protein